jgi:hypothetical protein
MTAFHYMLIGNVMYSPICNFHSLKTARNPV